MRAVHLTIGLPPERLGGTEVYVASLVDHLAALGCAGDVVFVVPVDDGPLRRVVEPRGAGRVVRLLVPRREHRLERLLVDAHTRRAVAGALAEACLELEPDLLHVHPLTVALESEVVARVHPRAPVVLTYHTAPASCLRGDLLRRGAELCDGRLEVGRCRACYLDSRGLPAPLVPLVRGLSGTGWRPHGRLRRLGSLLDLAAAPEALDEAWGRLRAGVDRFVAGSAWVRDLLRQNGVADDRLLLSPHGVDAPIVPRAPSTARGPLRVGFLGRFRAEKGAAVLLDALERLRPDLPLEVELVGPTFDRPAPEDRRLVERARALARRDPRVRLAGGRSPGETHALLAGWDALLVPSLAPEVGPLVVLEAQAAGIPVIGSRRAGIAERVTEGVSGYLVEPGDVSALAARLEACARAPDLVRGLRERIPIPRTVGDVARDMLGLYERLTATRRVEA